MNIEKESREFFMSLPAWNARDALRILLEIHPDAVQEGYDFDSAEIEHEARALISWLYRFGILPRAIREPYDAAPERIDDYLDAIGGVRRTPAEWIAAAAANHAAPADWLESLQATSDAPETSKPLATVGIPSAEIIEKFRLNKEWIERLRKPDRNKYLLSALAQRGQRGGGSHRWNPAFFGKILMTRKVRNQLALSEVIYRHFTDYSDEWDSILAPKE